jgi:hypothetical protein
MKNKFGYCLRGSDLILKLSAIPKDAYINHLSGSEINSKQVIDTKSLKDHLDSFFLLLKVWVRIATQNVEAVNAVLAMGDLQYKRKRNYT